MTALNIILGKTIMEEHGNFRPVRISRRWRNRISERHGLLIILNFHHMALALNSPLPQYIYRHRMIQFGDYEIQPVHTPIPYTQGMRMVTILLLWENLLRYLRVIRRQMIRLQSRAIESENTNNFISYAIIKKMYIKNLRLLKTRFYNTFGKHSILKSEE